MNCDQAFDCLTDPARRHSAQLEEHLAHCGRCRQMHDTLEPALDMFDELIPEPDLSSGIVTTQTLAPEAVRVAEQAAARLRAADEGQRPRRRGTVLRYAAAAMAGALLMGVMGSINQAPPPSPPFAESASNRMADVPLPIPMVIVPEQDPTETPVRDRTSCLLISGVVDRLAYPTPAAVVRRCTECHDDGNAMRFPGRAQPISIEAPGDAAEEADLIVRMLSAREHSRMIAAGRHALCGVARLA